MEKEQSHDIDVFKFVESITTSIEQLSNADGDFKKSLVLKISEEAENKTVSRRKIEKVVMNAVGKTLIDLKNCEQKIELVTDGSSKRKKLRATNFDEICKQISSSIGSFSMAVFVNNEKVGQFTNNSYMYLMNIYIDNDGEITVPIPILQLNQDFTDLMKLFETQQEGAAAAADYTMVELESTLNQESLLEANPESTTVMDDACIGHLSSDSDPDDDKEKKLSSPVRKPLKNDRGKKRKHEEGEVSHVQKKRKRKEKSIREKQLVEKNTTPEIKKNLSHEGLHIEGDETESFKKHLHERIELSEVNEQREKIRNLIEGTKKLSSILGGLLLKTDSMLESIEEYFDEETQTFAGPCKACPLHECQSILRLKGSRGRPLKQKD